MSEVNRAVIICSGFGVNDGCHGTAWSGELCNACAKLAELKGAKARAAADRQRERLVEAEAERQRGPSLERCPFCGGPAQYRQVDFSDMVCFSWTCGCKKCRIWVQSESAQSWDPRHGMAERGDEAKTTVAAKWNRREGPSA